MNVPPLLDRVYYGNPLSAWLVALTVFVVGGLALVVMRRVIIARLARFAERTPTTVDDVALGALRRTRVSFLFAVTLVVATHVALRLPANAYFAVHLLGKLALLLQGASWGSGAITLWFERMGRRRGEHDKASLTTINVLSIVARIVMWVLILLLALQAFGINVTALITGLGIAGIAVALAVQNVLGDLLASLTIALDRPFVIGDTLNVDGLVGTVEDIGLKTTRMRALTGELLVFPNADLLKARIRNYRGQVQRRVTTTVGVEYGTPLDLVARIPTMIREIMAADPLLRLDRSHLSALGDSALVFETVYYVASGDYALYMESQQRFYLELLRRFADAGIRIAFPTRTVVLTTESGSDGVPAAVQRAG